MEVTEREVEFSGVNVLWKDGQAKVGDFIVRELTAVKGLTKVKELNLSFLFLFPVEFFG